MIRIYLLLFALISTPQLSWATATSLFSELHQYVFQIRVIDIASGDKYTIGSGFQIESPNDQISHIATNFHVVSSYIHQPEKYRLEIIQTGDDETEEAPQTAQLLTFDVIHDLALLSTAKLNTGELQLSKSPLEKGDRIYSMGNPHDLGMTIIEGNYNGLLQNSRYQKILFSGSLNSGMSGGPAINDQGDVIGINVSTQGDEISYLVPVSYLDQLQQNAKVYTLPLLTAEQDTANLLQSANTRLIHDSLFEDQSQYFSKVLSNKHFETETLGDVTVATNLSPSLKCWGHSTGDEEDGEKSKTQGAHQHCLTEDQIYVDSDLGLGAFHYDYEWITSAELNPFQFYAALEERFEHGSLGNTYQERYVTEFKCADDVITLAEHSWKISSCFRAYKDYPNLYDAQLVMVSIDGTSTRTKTESESEQATNELQTALLAKIGAAAISRDNALLLFKRFMESISWNK